MNLCDYITLFLKPLRGKVSFWLFLCSIAGFSFINTYQIIFLGSGIDLFSQDLLKALMLLAIYLLFLLMAQALLAVSQMIKAKTKYAQSMEIRERIYNKLMKCQWQWWKERDKGEYKLLLSDQLEEMVEDSLTMQAKVLEVAIGGGCAVIAAFAVQPVMAAIICIYLPIAVFWSLQVGKGCLKTHEDKQKALRYESGILASTVRGIQEIILNQKKPIFLNQCDQGIKEVKKAENAHIRMVMKYRIAEEIAKIVGYIGVLIGGFYFYQQHTLSLGSILIMLKLSDMIFLQLSQINYIYDLFNSVKGYYETFQETLQAPEQNFGDELPQIGVPTVYDLRQVYFSYTADHPVISNMNLMIAKGSHVVIVGESGSGKTTLFHLLCRLYDQDSGEILLFGQKLQLLSHSSLYGCMSVVTQFPYIFNASCYENIAWGSPDADEEQVRQAAVFAGFRSNQIESFLNRQTGEHGNQLSGGEKQRIAIARCFLQNRPLIILDEPTSMLDGATENTIMENIRTQWKEKTVIVITHKKEQCSQFNQVIQL